MSRIEPGALHWFRPEGEAVAHPHLVIEVFDTLQVTVCGLTTNLHRAKAPGNVLLEAGEGGLAKQSVVQASHLRTVALAQLGARIGALSPERLGEARRGVAFLETLRAR